MNEIRPYEGYKPVQEQQREQLPVGAYPCQIINTQVETRQDGNQMLAIMVEIMEGNFAGFFRKDYANQQGRLFSPKYRGIYRILCPGSNLRPEDSWIVDRFNLMIGAIMASNPGFTWNWDASSLKGLKIGISVRENEFRGNVYTEIGKLIPISTTWDGTFRPMHRRISRDNSGSIVQGYVSPYTHSHTTVSPDPQVMIPRAGGYSLPQGTGPQTVQSGYGQVAENPPPAPPSGLPQNYLDDKAIPF